jgi:hypothetical protein
MSIKISNKKVVSKINNNEYFPNCQLFIVSMILFGFNAYFDGDD